MNVTVLLVGALVLAIFILPFYFVTHSKSKDEKAGELAPKPEIHSPAMKAPGRKGKTHRTKH
jgi:hypothetical protein